MRSMLSLLSAANIFMAFAFAQMPRYKITDLGPVGPPPGEPYYIAATGLIAGAAATASGKNTRLYGLEGMRLISEQTGSEDRTARRSA